MPTDNMTNKNMNFNNLEADFLRNKLQSVVTFIERDGDVPDSFYNIVENQLREAIEILDSMEDTEKYETVKKFLRGLSDLFLQLTLTKRQPTDKIKRDCRRYLEILKRISN